MPKFRCNKLGRDKGLEVLNQVPQYSLDKFFKSISDRFGVYLDTMLGFNNNLIWIEKIQSQSSIMTNLSIDRLDETDFIRGNGHPSAGIEKHRMSQRQFKKNNSFGRINRQIALKDCLASFFNEWTTFKRDILKKKGYQDKNIPLIFYLGKVRDRITHTDENSNKIKIEPLSLSHTNYKLPGFEAFQTVELSENDLDAIVFELKSVISQVLK